MNPFRLLLFFLWAAMLPAAEVVIHPVPHDVAAAELRALRTVLRSDPQNLSLAVHVAKELVEKARREGSPQPLSHAMAALAPWWEGKQPHPEILLLRATIRQSLHEFPAALTDLDALVEQCPQHAQSWLTRGTVQLVSGNLKASVASCERLRDLVSPLVHAAALTAAESLQQDTPAASGLEKCLSEKCEASPAVQSWACAILAEHHARWGRSQRADEWFREGLALTPEDRPLLAARADFLIAEKLAGSVKPLLAGHTSDDLLLLRLALALKSQHEPAAVYMKVLAGHAATTRALGVALHLREESMLYLHLLDDPQTALPLAAENFKIQREPADARLLLLAAAAARQPEAARPVLDWMQQQGVKSPDLLQLAAALHIVNHKS